MADALFYSEKKRFPAKITLAAAAVLAVCAVGFLLIGNAQQGNGAAGHAQGGSLPAAEENGNSNYPQGITRDYGIPKGVFENLPKAPADFNMLVSMLHRQEFTNYAFFSREYFLQPEFYPSFMHGGIIYWQKPDAKYVGVAGMGFYPSERKIKVARGGRMVAYFFVHAAFGARYYQGVKIAGEGGENSAGITAEVTEPEFVLGPTYPKFSGYWARKVGVKITVPQDAQEGEYKFVFTVAKPSAENSAEWEKAAKGRYFETSRAGAAISHTLTVKVE